MYKKVEKINAIFVMNTPFPYGEAFSSRARNLVKLLCSCGYHIHIIAPKSAREIETGEMIGYDYSVYYIYDPKNIVTLSGIGTAKPYMKAINEYLEKNKVHLIVSNSMVFVADYLLKLAKKLKVPYIIEQCEWYDVSTFKFGKWNPFYREHIRRIEKKNREVDGVIAISRLFEQHYSFQGVPTIRIPTILDMKNIEYRIEKSNSNRYHIVFAGSLGKGKEEMAPVFQALIKVNQGKIKIIFDIYGPNEKEIFANIKNDAELWRRVQPFINIHGYIPQNEVEDVIRKADFTIFTRPIRRSSNAGFPTKFAESMAVGTPVITNDTGDINLYLKNEKNGFLMTSGSEKEVLNIFNMIILLNDIEYIEMRKNAREMAVSSFDYGIYLKKMKEFLLKYK